MKRLLLNLLTALSLLLCVAVGVLWARSYGNQTDPLLDLPYATALYRCGAESKDGHFGLSLNRWTWETPAPPRPRELVWVESPPEPSRSWWVARRPRGDGVQVLGVEIFYRAVYRHRHSTPRRQKGSYVYGGFVMPHAYAVAALLVLPTLRLRRAVRKRRRQVDNRCTQCGYDLRATPGRCPECGRAPAKARRDTD
jgi:hypothetical protein